ncbi:MAG: hypothetical protein XD82_1453, partial [Methanoculleus marisnigri]
MGPGVGEDILPGRLQCTSIGLLIGIMHVR